MGTGRAKEMLIQKDTGPAGGGGTGDSKLKKKGEPATGLSRGEKGKPISGARDKKEGGCWNELMTEPWTGETIKF